MTSWLRSGVLHVTLTDLIEFDHQYPGVLTDADTIIWQIELIKRQANGGPQE